MGQCNVYWLDYITFLSFFEIRPPYLKEYTDPTKKRKRQTQIIPLDTISQQEQEEEKPLVADPDPNEPDPKKYRMFQLWMNGDIPNEEGRESGVGVFDAHRWIKLRTRFMWLEDGVS